MSDDLDGYDDLEDLDRERRSTSIDSPPVFTLLSLRDIADLAPPKYIIGKHITDKGLAVIFGAPGSYKTFLALDMGLSIAHDIFWQDRLTEAGSVIYIAGEGVGGISKRIRAWREHHNADDGAFHLLKDAVNLLDLNGDVAKSRIISGPSAS